MVRISNKEMKELLKKEDLKPMDICTNDVSGERYYFKNCKKIAIDMAAQRVNQSLSEFIFMR